MAVKKVYACDFCGADIWDEDDVLVVRVGTLASRPEDAERLEAGPCCGMTGQLDVARKVMISRRAMRGQDVNGHPLLEEVADGQEQEAPARA